MNADAAPTQRFCHDIGFYASDDEFRELIYPFAMEGLESDEPVVFAYDTHKTQLLQQWLPEDGGICYIAATEPYATPTKALAKWHKVVTERLADGAERIRLAGDVPHPGYGQSYAGWDRYEAAIDRVLGEFPIWAPCLYDTRLAPPEVLESALRSHHHILQGTGARHLNHSFKSAEQLADFFLPPEDPVERTEPHLQLLEPTPASAREAVARGTAGTVGQGQLSDLQIAVSEAVTNALIHGRPPVALRLWVAKGRVVVHIVDAGPGPSDPLAGLLPADDDLECGRGLWLTHQLDIDVALIPSPEGFTVRLRAGSELLWA